MRKTKLDAMKTRQLLIDTAITEFARRGVSNTTLADIAEAAHVTRGAIYWHFSSKIELFNEIWKEQEQLCESSNTSFSVESSGNPLALLRVKLVNILKSVTIDKKYRALMEIFYHKCEFTQEMVSEWEAQNTVFFNTHEISQLVKNGIDKKIINPLLDVNVIVIILHGFLSGIIMNWLMRPDSFNLYLQAETLVDNMLRFLAVDTNNRETLSKALALSDSSFIVKKQAGWVEEHH